MVVAIGVGIAIMLSGQKAEQAQELEQAFVDSVKVAERAQAAVDSVRLAAAQNAAAAVQTLRDRFSQADLLQAGKRAKADYDRANEYLEEAVRLAAAGDANDAERQAQLGLERIDSAIDRSGKIQEREELAQKDRDQALARLRTEVGALQESLSVLQTNRGPAFAAAQMQQLQQIVEKASQMADAGNLNDAQDQVSYAYDMTSKVRLAIGDGLRQEEEAKRLLEQRRAQAAKDSIERAKIDSTQLALPPTRPVITKQVSPVYPRAAEAAGISGTVEVEFEVGIDGRARDFKVVKSLGAGCDESAVDALKQWEFKPATQGGKPVPVRISFPIVFKRR
ncbi:energy transducer TonB [Candidatus Fermentibacteria bacterium]|nr:energy transducer TonB [Candidatus Fermentibacteria bacterium]